MTDLNTVDELRNGMSTVHNTRPVAEIMQRGRTIRTQRRRRSLIALAATLAGAAGLTAVTTVTNSSPAYADWTSTPEPTTTAVSAVIDNNCRSMLPTGTNLRLAVLDRRGKHAVAIYSNRATDYACDLFQGSGKPGDGSYWSQGGAGGSSDRITTTPTAAHPLVISGSGATFVARGGGQATYLFGRASSTVAHIKVAIPGRTVNAAVRGGRFDAWWPSINARNADVTITAYADDGTVLDTTTAQAPGFSTS